VIDPAALQMVLCVLTGWLDRREREAITYLRKENRLERTGWAVRPYGRSPPLRRRIRCCAGIGS